MLIGIAPIAFVGKTDIAKHISVIDQLLEKRFASISYPHRLPLPFPLFLLAALIQIVDGNDIVVCGFLIKTQLNRLQVVTIDFVDQNSLHFLELSVLWYIWTISVDLLSIWNTFCDGWNMTSSSNWFSFQIQVVQGVIMISWRQKVLERQIDYGAKLGQVVLSLARMELNNFYKNVIPVADYFDQSNMLISVSKF